MATRRLMRLLAVLGLSYGAFIAGLVWLLRDFPDSWS